MKRHSDAWKVNNAINLTLLDCIDDAYFNDASGKRDSDVPDQFAQLHQFRLLWLSQSAPELFAEYASSLPAQVKKPNLQEALRSSGEGMTKMIEMKFQEGRVMGFPSPADFLNYLVSCESVFRNKIVLMLL